MIFILVYGIILENIKIDNMMQFIILSCFSLYVKVFCRSFVPILEDFSSIFRKNKGRAGFYFLSLFLFACWLLQRLFTTKVKNSTQGVPHPHRVFCPCFADYLMVTLAPASSSFAFSSSASSFGRASLRTFGTASTKSFASFNPRPVTSRTTLITLIF